MPTVRNKGNFEAERGCGLVALYFLLQEVSPSSDLLFDI